MIPIPELGIEVEDVSDFNDEASEWLTGFCEGLEATELREATEDDCCEPGTKLWSIKATNMIENEINWLYLIGNKYFGETLDLDISSHMYQEIE